MSPLSSFLENTFCKLRSERQELGQSREYTAGGKAVLCAPVPVHDVGGESSGEAEHVEADLGGCAEAQAGHDWEQGQIHPQPCTQKG